MKVPEPNTEERIKEAARKVFMKKGFKGATAREIAIEADVNGAMMNYYFRKKEKLFQIIFRETVDSFVDDLEIILNKDVDLKGKIRLVINKITTMTEVTPDISYFIYNEIRNNQNQFIIELSKRKNKILDKWKKQIQENIRKKIIRNIDPIMVFSLVMTCIQFPIIGEAFLRGFGNYTDDTYQEFLKEHTERSFEMVINYLFVQKKKPL